MPAMIKLGEHTATVTNKQWSSDDPDLLFQATMIGGMWSVADATDHIGGMVDIDNEIAKYVAKELGGEVVALTKRPYDGDVVGAEVVSSDSEEREILDEGESDELE